MTAGMKISQHVIVVMIYVETMMSHGWNQPMSMYVITA